MIRLRAAVVAELALRYRDLVRALKGQKLRTGNGAARELDHADGCAQRPHRPHVILPFERNAGSSRYWE